MRPGKKLAANVVRLFKYLAADYFEEFVHSCDTWLQRAFRVVGADQDNPGERAKAAALLDAPAPELPPPPQAAPAAEATCAAPADPRPLKRLRRISQ